MWMSVTNLCNVLTLRRINARDKRNKKLSGDLLVGYIIVYILVLYAKKIFLVFYPYYFDELKRFFSLA